MNWVDSMRRGAAVAILVSSGVCLGSAGCSDSATKPSSAGGSGSKPAAPTPIYTPPATADPKALQELNSALSKIVNETEIKYKELKIQLPLGFNENVLDAIDKAEASLSGRAPGPFPRQMPTLSEEEEKDHFRETFKRWSAKTGKDIRSVIDPLVAEVKARKPGAAKDYRDFHKRFGDTLADALIPIEVAEIRARQNKQIHARVKEALGPYREKHAELVRYFEDVIHGQYPLATDAN